MHIKKLISLALLLAAPTLNAATLSEMTISSAAISGASDVSTTGTLVGAWTFGQSDAISTYGNDITVNGQAFTIIQSNGTFDSISDGAFTISQSGGASTTKISTYALYNYISSSKSAPASAAEGSLIRTLWDNGGSDQAYISLLGQGVNRGNSSNMLVTLTNLTIGNEYQVQFWFNNSAIAQDARNASITAGTSTGNMFSLNNGNADEGLGTFVTVNFTADGTDQEFIISNSHQNRTINALQLRAIPEPSTYALGSSVILIGALVLIRRRRK